MQTKQLEKYGVANLFWKSDYYGHTTEYLIVTTFSTNTKLAFRELCEIWTIVTEKVKKVERTLHHWKKNRILRGRKKLTEIKRVIFQIFGKKRNKSDRQNTKVLYKKKLKYAKYFYAQIGDKNVAPLHCKRVDRNNP